MRAEYHIHTTYNPLELWTETYRKKLSTIKVGEYYPLRINWWVPPYTITRASGTSATHLSHPVGKLEETDDLINIYGLKSWTTTFEVTDKKWSVETIDVTIVEYLRTLTIWDPLTFSGREWFTISSITSKSGRSLDIARAWYRWTIDTFDWRGGDTLYVTYESQVMGKRFETEVRVVEWGNNQVVGSNWTLSDFEERTLSVWEFDIVELPKSSNIEREYDNTKLFIKKVPWWKRRERIDSININSNENSVGILWWLSEWKIRDSIEIASAASLTDQYLIWIKDWKSSWQEVYKIYIKIDNKEVELVIHHSYDAARMPITPDYITVPYNNTDLAISWVWSEDRDIFDTKLIPDWKRNWIDDYILKFRWKNPWISYIHVELWWKDFNNYWDVKYADYRLEELVIPIEVYNKDYTDITEDFRDKLLMSAINMENLKSLEDGVFDIPRLTYLKWKKYLYYYNQVNTDKPWDYKNLAQIEWWYEWLPFVKIWTNNYSTEITWNFWVGYSASAWGIPLLIQYWCSYWAQYLLDRRYHTGNWDDEIPLYYETLINELWDRNQILRWHLLYRDHGVDLEWVEYRKYLETPIEDLMWGRINIQSSECNDIVFDLSV